MRNSRLGCLTSGGIVATLITLFALAGVAFASGSLMFSPGELNDRAGTVLGGAGSHAEIKECSACHAAAWSSISMAERCADCHTGIAAQLLDVTTLHGAIADQDPGLACRDCHPEHRGPAGALTELGGHSIPHEVVGFSLKAHQLTVKQEPFTCADCHQADITTFKPDTCGSCHAQIDAGFSAAHAEAYGTACMDCHDGVDHFSQPFDHAGFAFKLEGGHENVACDKCHIGVHALAGFAETAQDCYACHAARDAHQGAFGEKCDTCHNPSDWKDAAYDHDLSGFKLEGKHTAVKCEACHLTPVSLGTPTDCFSCHKQDDHHEGKFGQECSACHTTTGWEDVTFDHNSSNFPLTGAHANTDCGNCHKNNTFKGLSAACVSCHGDPTYHAGMFGTNCAACHNTNNWSAKYSGSHPGIADEGGRGVNHGGASCRTCHTVSLHSATCKACHDGNGGGGGD